ncbi:MAG: hypothetical protein Q3972_00390 [Corynebacterium sp.]|nr:hypothetical protein [Corynebacterium sp.]
MFSAKRIVGDAVAGALLFSGAPAFADTPTETTITQTASIPVISTVVPTTETTTTDTDTATDTESSKSTTVYYNQATAGFSIIDTIDFSNLVPNAEYAVRANIFPTTEDGSIDYASGAVLTNVGTVTTDENGAGEYSTKLYVQGGLLENNSTYRVLFTLSYENPDNLELTSITPEGTTTGTGEQVIQYTDDYQVLTVVDTDLIHGAKEALDTIMPAWTTYRSATAGLNIYNTLAATTAGQALSSATGSSTASILSFVGSSAATVAIAGSSIFVLGTGLVLSSEIGGFLENHNA